MTRPDDSKNAMAGFPSSRDADLLLGGRVRVDDLPDDAAPIAALLSALRSGTASSDPVAERRAISAIAAGLRNRHLDSPSSRGIVRRMPARAAALAFAAVLVSGTAAAAVTGSLPDPVQRAVSTVLERAHISVPSPDDPAAGASPGPRVTSSGPSTTRASAHRAVGAGGTRPITGPGSRSSTAGTRPGRKAETPAAGPTGPTGPANPGGPSAGSTTTTGSSTTTTTTNGASPPTTKPGNGSGNGQGTGPGSGNPQGTKGQQGHTPPTRPVTPSTNGNGSAGNGKSGSAPGKTK